MPAGAPLAVSGPLQSPDTKRAIVRFAMNCGRHRLKRHPRRGSTLVLAAVFMVILKGQKQGQKP